MFLYTSLLILNEKKKRVKGVGNGDGGGVGEALYCRLKVWKERYAIKDKRKQIILLRSGCRIFQDMPVSFFYHDYIVDIQVAYPCFSILFIDMNPRLLCSKEIWVQSLNVISEVTQTSLLQNFFHTEMICWRGDAAKSGNPPGNGSTWPLKSSDRFVNFLIMAELALLIDPWDYFNPLVAWSLNEQKAFI